MGRRTATCILWFAVLPVAAAEGEFQAFGHLAASGSSTPDERSWRDGGVGRYLPAEPRLSAHIGLLWQPSLDWDVRVHARLDSDDGFGAAPIGLVEAFAARRLFSPSGAFWQIKAGQFFLPTSREAVDPLWQSPHHLSLSTLNSWIAEEFRPIGVDLSWRNAPQSEFETEWAATVFGGNDSAGALLAWRGFASHDRLTAFGEVLRLPSLPTLSEGFAGQRDDGSKPFGPDLDGRPGYALRTRFGQREPLASPCDRRRQPR